MGKLLVFFVVGFIGLSLRFIILDRFELDQLLILLLFPIGAMGILFISRKQITKDATYQAEEDLPLSTKLSDRISTGQKFIYAANKKIGTYNRFYKKWWHRIIAEIMDNPGTWYLNLTFTLSNGDEIKIVETNDNQFKKNKDWTIFRNGVEYGAVRTDYSFKNTKRLREGLFLDINEQSYYYKSNRLSSHTEISLDDYRLATGKRTKGSIYELSISEDEEMLFIAFILFNYTFHQ